MMLKLHNEESIFHIVNPILEKWNKINFLIFDICMYMPDKIVKTHDLMSYKRINVWFSDYKVRVL